MTDDAKSPEKSGADTAQLVHDLSSQGISVEQVLKGMEPQKIYTFLIGQYNMLSERYTSIEQQLRRLEALVKSDSKETTQRIERILALMTSNLTFIKQMIQLEDVDNDKLVEQEKVSNRQDLQVATLIERQNRYAVSLATMDKNNHTIMEEIAKLKEKDVEHDKFHIKVMTIASVVSGIAIWLLTGDNLAKLTVFLVNITGSK